ncbi:MAG: hypothetical protein J6X18_04125 [Bacteroidales bacterium]|nr:hypothetical protein [Bacteroidales bacterium]
MAEKQYNWKFSTVGGVPRVNIESGEDIAHLKELDQKMWTVLSCPTKGLEIDEKTLELMDLDGDGKIRVHEVVEAATWITKVLKNPDLLLKQEDTISLDDINQDDEDGKKLYDSAKQILANLELDKNEISVADTSDSIAIFAKTKFNGDGVITENSTDDEALKAVIANCVKTIGSSPDRSGVDGVNAEQIEAFYANCNDYMSWFTSEDENKATVFPYGDNTEAALAAYNALKEKVEDFFMRCKLTAFNSDSSAALDVTVARFEAISEKSLSACTEEIAGYPLARVNGKLELPLNGGINPAWEAAFANLKSLIFDVDFPKQKSISEADWNAIGAKFGPYEAWKAAKKGEVVESLGVDVIKEIVEKNQKDTLLALVEQDKAEETKSNEIVTVNKLTHYYRDIYKLIKNYVTFSDFYTRDENKKAIFQAGTLYIDQRSCDLCVKVSDMGKHNLTAGLSGMYLLYCDCHSKKKNETMTIVAVMTDGDIDNLMVGKNAIFYDRDGVDWDATVVKIIDNPISIRQAFWSPYRKFANWVTDLINKSAAEKDSKSFDNMTASVSEKAAAVPAEGAAPQQAQPFDIAKFAGIFAAIGMALGFLGSFCVSVVSGFAQLTWWQVILVFIGIILLISGPSMVMAWLKLRKRNLAPLLNANGWAVNAQAFVNITFGATLTKIAQFPKVALADPFADKGMAWWKKLLIGVVLLAIGVAALWYFDIWPFNCGAEAEVTECAADTLQTVADTIQQVADTTAVAE